MDSDSLEMDYQLMEKVECRLKIFTGLFNSRLKRVTNKIGKNNVFRSVRRNMLNSVLAQVEIHQKPHKLRPF